MTSYIKKYRPGEYYVGDVLNERENWINSFDKIFDNIVTQAFPDMYKTVGLSSLNNVGYPKVNVLSRPNELVIEAELAGFNKEDINVEVKDYTLTISGKQQASEQTDKEVYLIRELKRSGFSRSFKLGEQLDVDHVDAKFYNGLLSITIKKLVKEPEISKKVTIN